MVKIERFEDIEAWRKARELTGQIYDVSNDGLFPFLPINSWTHKGRQIRVESGGQKRRMKMVKGKDRSQTKT